tara:strand:+ start:14827 stop:14931 length:105 start_codon:yes stop_codon:yes gene_type:complete
MNITPQVAMLRKKTFLFAFVAKNAGKTKISTPIK